MALVSVKHLVDVMNGKAPKPKPKSTKPAKPRRARAHTKAQFNKYRQFIYYHVDDLVDDATVVGFELKEVPEIKCL